MEKEASVPTWKHQPQKRDHADAVEMGEEGKGAPWILFVVSLKDKIR